MVGLDSNPQPQQNPQQQDQTIFFNKGEEVEVSSEEEGFRGAWYVATILEFPKPQPQATVKSASKKKRKAIVQYKTLVTEDGSIPLVEQVDPHLIRPFPPQDLLENDGFFQENEAIDASLRDGWWSGVVKKVLDGGSRYMVYFDNPPDVLEFDAKALRLHLDWVDGNWVRPKRQRQATGSVFSPGTEVEVNLEKDNVRDVWLPAVVIKENEDKTFLVRWLSSRNSDEAGTMKIIVDFLHIRPPPPCYEERNYELLERVDTCYGFGWRSGVITKLLAGRRYNVFFKQGNEDKELSHSRIRPHLDWVDGKWISKSKEVRVVSDSQGQFVGTNSSDNPDVAVQLKSSSAAEDKTIEKTVSSSIRNPTETNSGEKSVKKLKLTLYNGGGIRSSASTMLTEVDTTEASVSVTALQSRKIPIEMSSNEKCCGFTTSKTGGKRARCIEKHMADAHPSNKTEKFSAGKTTKAKPHRVPELDCPKVDIVTRKGRVTKSPFKSPNVSAAVDGDAVEVTVQGISENDVKTKDIEVPIIIGLKAIESIYQDDKEMLKLARDRKKSLNDSTKDKNMEYVGSSQRRKRGRPCKLIEKSKALVASKDFVSVDIANEVVQVVVKDLTTNEVEWPTQARVEPKVSQNSSREKSSEAPKTDFMSREAAAAASQNVADDDQPLSTWFGNMQAPTSLEESRLSTGRIASGVSVAREKYVVEVETSTVDPKSNDTLVGNQSVPFVKRSPVWNTIESMEVFQIIPQKPHFHPLTECKGEYREGSAIGIMVE
ncbi:AGENET DOMAIN-CONTAINING PROTEIN-RELATED [Salix viminalis]|uniref:AGENET DOMAIN-CONTAINING PROTEIN-RELATED n=1 Tax=Salix viminalis TaxID=40686 RepID=A0A9Q0UG47_SALVM|nr:AGENET DOMAIN-CONTAINING PROTEIN-RELATED [Salix viminalis]